MALPIQAIPALRWQNYAGGNRDLVAVFDLDFASYSSIQIQPKGGYGVASGVVSADGVIIDNLLNSQVVTCTIGALVERIPPYTKGQLHLTPQMAQIVITAPSASTSVKATFYTGTYRGSAAGVNTYEAQRSAIADLQTGFMAPWPGDVTQIPAGWLLCDGSPVSRVTYADLYAKIGTLWGAGDGATSFNLPDFRSRFPIGAGQGAGLTNRGLASYGGVESVALTAAQNGPHTHTVTDLGHTHTVSDPGHVHTLSDPSHGHGVSDPGHAHSVGDSGHAHNPVGGGGAFGSGTAYAMSQSANGYFMNATSQNVTGIAIGSAATGISIFGSLTGITMATKLTGITLVSANTGVSIASSGSGAAHDNMPPWGGVNWLIKT